jgi:exosortase/archaeosortase family protein
MSFIEDANRIIRKYNLYALREVALFMLITLIIHYSYRYWAGTWGFSPLENVVIPAREWLSAIVYQQSKWFVINILSISVTYDDAKQIMYFGNGAFLGVNMSCSGFKQLLQLALLFLVYPGPVKHKVWFIPLGIVVIYFVNVLRIIILAVVVDNRPEYFEFTHDYIVRPFF